MCSTALSSGCPLHVPVEYPVDGNARLVVSDAFRSDSRSFHEIRLAVGFLLRRVHALSCRTGVMPFHTLAAILHDGLAGSETFAAIGPAYWSPSSEPSITRAPRHTRPSECLCHAHRQFRLRASGSETSIIHCAIHCRSDLSSRFQRTRGTDDVGWCSLHGV